MKKGILITPQELKQYNWIEKIKELKLNTLGLHSGGGPNHNVIAALGETATESFRSRISSVQGLDLEYECHVSGTLLEDELFNTHPEFFQKDFLTGKRTTGGNWCVTNPELMAWIGKKARQLTEKLPSSTHRYYYWTADNPLAWCHCPQCSHYTMSEQNLLAMNALLAEIRKVDPLAELAFLAYHNTITVPDKVKPVPGVFLEFAPYPRCYQHAINDPECEINRKYWIALRRLLEVFDPRRTQILEYWLDVSYFSHYRKPTMRPVVCRDLIKRDIEAYLSLGIRNFTTFAVYMDGEYLQKEGDAELCMYAQLLNEYLKE